MVTSGYVLKIIVKKEYIMRCTYKQGKFTFPPEIKFTNDELVIICIEKDDFNIYTNEQFMAATSIIKQGLEHSKKVSSYARAILSSAYQEVIKNNEINFEGWMKTQLTENTYEITTYPTHCRVVGEKAKMNSQYTEGTIEKMLSDVRAFLELIG